MSLLTEHRWQRSTIDAVAVVVVSCVLIISGTITSQSIRRMQRNAEMKDLSHAALSSLDRLEFYLRDAHNGQMDFLRTGEAEYLKTFEAAIEKISRTSQELITLSADSPLRQFRMKQLLDLIEQKTNALRTTVQVQRLQGTAAAVAIVNSEVNAKLMDEIRVQLSDVRTNADTLLDARSLTSARAYEYALWTALVSTFTGLALVGAVLTLVQRNRTRSDKAAASLFIERERLLVTVANIGDGLIVCDRTCHVTFLNPVSERLTGWTDAEASARPLHTVFRICHEETQQSVENAATRAVSKGATVEISDDTLLVSKDGSKVSIDHKASPIRDSSGNITGVVLVFRDVTERRNEERRLRETAEFTRRIVDTLGEVVVVLDSELKVLHVNRAFVTTFQSSEERVLGQSVYQLDDGAWDLPVLHNLLDRALNNLPSTTQLEIEPNLIHIGHKSLRLTASRFDGRSQRKEAVLLVMSDVTEERLLEQKVHQQDQHMRWFLSQIKDYAIFTMDAECRATSWNQGVREVLGFEEHEFIGHDISKLIFTHEAQALGTPQVEFSLAALDQRASDDRWMMRKNGEYFWASGITTSIRDENDHLIGYCKVMRDLTAQKQSQDEMTEIAVKLSEMDRRKNEFLATLAHELRNPLAPIKNAVQLMGLSRLDPEIDDLRKMMARQVEQIVRLIDDLLDVSRIGRGKISLRRETVELKSILEGAIEASATMIAENGQQLSINIDNEPPIFVHADPSRLMQVVSNLLNNAARYSDAGCSVQLTATREQEFAVVRVRDNGIGIDPGRLEDIFHMFAQVDDTPERGNTGLGIGLTLVRTLVELHDGTVKAESAGPGKGSTFTIRIPAVDTVVQPCLPPAAANQTAVSHRSFRVLVVEDMRALRVILTRLLGKLGHQVEYAENGAVALQRLEEYAPEVIFSDIAMPGMTGYELARRIRQKPEFSGVYLVALTGFGQTSDRDKAINAGFDEHMVKPIDIIALQALFEKLAT